VSPTLLLPEFPELFEVPLIPVICADKAQQGQVSRVLPHSLRSVFHVGIQLFSSKLFFFPGSHPRSVACDFAFCHVQHMLEFFLYVKTAKNIVLPQILAVLLNAPQIAPRVLPQFA
jgi:hypothetical protein